MDYDLGKINKVDLRKAWKSEAFDFTSWLVEPENLSLLSDEIGIDIKPIETEASVGRYNVDILAKEENSERKIIIENQLESTNHDHLGKLVTYAAGYDASIVIWIVKDANEEHRQAIDWLNENTGENINFFLIKVELWQIGDSPYAPKFDIISKPNEWAKILKQSVERGGITEVKTQQLEFWNNLKTYIESQKSTLKLTKPRPQHWYNIRVGSSHAYISLSLNSFDDAIRTELYIPNSKEVFHFLEDKQKDIERELGLKLVWQELPGKKASRLKIEREGNIDHVDDWEDYHKWLTETAEKFMKVFSKRLKKFK